MGNAHCAVVMKQIFLGFLLSFQKGETMRRNWRRVKWSSRSALHGYFFSPALYFPGKKIFFVPQTHYKVLLVVEKLSQIFFNRG